MEFAVQVALGVARRLLKSEQTTKRQARALVKAIKALEAIPDSTEDLHCEFGVNYRNGDADFSEMRFIGFCLTDADLYISRGGSVYQKSVGSDSFSDPEWIISFDNGQFDGVQAGFDLFDIEATVTEYLNLGAEIDASDESDESDDDE